MRLIDADIAYEELIDFMCSHDVAIQDALQNKDVTLLEGIFFEYYESQKIAYDVDKVIEQIQDMHLPLASQTVRILDYVKRGGIDSEIRKY